MFNFTPLLGAKSGSRAVQSLLEFDGGIKVLVDVGWDVSFDASALQELEKQVPTISIVLLTHATFSHLGAFLHCCKHVPLFSRIPVYATTPVVSLGRTLLQDLYASSPLASSLLPKSSLDESTYAPSSSESEDPTILLPPPTNEEIAEYFSTINQLKYLQPHQPLPSSFSPPLDGLTITAHGAGHTLGGTIWHIQYGSESVVYAVDWNQAREQVFPGAAWLGGPGATGSEIVEQLRKPTALICSSKGASVTLSAGSRQQRDESLLDVIRTAIRDRGNVLIPCDSSARVLELAYMLERAWENDDNLEKSDSLHRARLYFASPTSATTMRYARAMLEWMDEGIIREFEASSALGQTNRPNQSKTGQPFAFKFLKLIERKSQIDRALDSDDIPKIFLASDASLTWGFSQHILQQFAGGPNNIVILSDRIETGETEASKDLWLAKELWDILERRQTAREAAERTVTASVVQCDSDTVRLRQVQTAPLAGEELAIYQQHLARQKQRQNAYEDGSSNLEGSGELVDDQSSSSSESSEDSDDEHQGKALNVSTALTHSKHKIALTDAELGINILLKKKGVYDFDVRGKKGRDRMFPMNTKRRKNDDYGELIRPEDYLRDEERGEADGADAQNGANADAAVGSKRKWNEADSSDPRKRGPAPANKRHKSSGEAQVNGTGHQVSDLNASGDESDESDYEPAEAVVRGPTKATITWEDVTLKLKISAIDFSGIHDKRSLHMLIPLIRPRKLILTAGDEEDTKLLATDCEKLLGAERDTTVSSEDEGMVLAPTNGTTVDASVDTNAWTIKLNPSFLRQVRWQKFRNLGVVTVSGRLDLVSDKPENNESASKRQKIESSKGEHNETSEQENKADAVAVLSDIPIGAAGSSKAWNQALHVGDVRLAELRRLLQATGHTAEFKGEGTLLVDSLVTVRKSGSGRIEVEAGGFGIQGVNMEPGLSFSLVKRRIYEGLAVVAAR